VPYIGYAQGILLRKNLRRRPPLFYKPDRSLWLLLGPASWMSENTLYFRRFLNYRYHLHFRSAFRAGHSQATFLVPSTLFLKIPASQHQPLKLDPAVLKVD
jgi:hypothetical protein